MARGKVTVPLDLPRPAALDDASGTSSKQECIYESLRAAILSRLLSSGSALPSSRTLAQRWGIARGTVEAVFERLVAEGYVSRVRGSGTRVNAVVPDHYLSSSAHQRELPGAPSAPDMHADTALVETTVRIGVPFVARLADPGLFPMANWVRHVRRAVISATPEQLCSSMPAGVWSLREQIADYLGKYRGIECHADDIFITTGIRHAIDLIARSTVIPGDTVCVEDPGYLSAQKIFSLAGASLAYIPVGAEGIDIGLLQHHADARLAYVTPAHQAPLGVTMSVTRRLELLDWASAAGAWIIEDDYDGEFSYHSAPLPALKSMDRDGRVVYCGSFNKTLFAGLRVGFVVAPTALRERLAELWQTTGRSVGITEQLALADTMQSGAFVKHLRRGRLAYLQRRDAILDCFAQHAHGRYSISGHHAGFHFILWLPPGWDERDFVARAAKEGVSLQPLQDFCRDATLPAAIVFGYTALSVVHARFAARKIARLLANDGAA